MDTSLFMDVSGLKAGEAISCGNKAFNLIHANDQRAGGNAFDSLNKSFGLVWHWTAGNSTDLYDDYHFNISTDISKTKGIVFKTLKFNEKGKHLWGRNTGMIGLSFCALSTSAANKPSAVMIDTGALLTAEICAWKRIDPVGYLKLPEKKQTADGASLRFTGGTIVVPTISDHATFAKTDGYYPDRVDIAEILPVLTKKAVQYYNELKKGTKKFSYIPLLQA